MVRPGIIENPIINSPYEGPCGRFLFAGQEISRWKESYPRRKANNGSLQN